MTDPGPIRRSRTSPWSLMLAPEATCDPAYTTAPQHTVTPASTTRLPISASAALDPTRSRGCFPGTARSRPRSTPRFRCQHEPLHPPLSSNHCTRPYRRTRDDPGAVADARAERDRDVVDELHRGMAAVGDARSVSPGAVTRWRDRPDGARRTLARTGSASARPPDGRHRSPRRSGRPGAGSSPTRTPSANSKSRNLCTSAAGTVARCSR
jgi:hypothetical protein